jgi:hypothetical protein
MSVNLYSYPNAFTGKQYELLRDKKTKVFTINLLEGNYVLGNISIQVLSTEEVDVSVFKSNRIDTPFNDPYLKTYDILPTNDDAKTVFNCADIPNFTVEKDTPYLTNTKLTSPTRFLLFYITPATDKDTAVRFDVCVM